MEKIGKTKLTMNKEMQVVVYADVYMQDANDADDALHRLLRREFQFASSASFHRRCICIVVHRPSTMHRSSLPARHDQVATPS